MVNVICLSTGNKFPDIYPVRLESMVRRHSTVPIRFTCFTDRDSLRGKVEQVLPPPCEFPGWWGKVGFFRPDFPLEGPIVFFDLDMLILQNIDDILTFDAEFALLRQTKDKIKSMTRFGRTCKGYNSSVMRWERAGCRSRIWSELSEESMHYWRGDQDWIQYLSPNEKTFPDEWFQYAGEKPGEAGKSGPEKTTKVTIHNKWDNHIVVDRWPWVKKNWQ